MKAVAEINWNWMLFKDEEKYILSVLCGSVGMYTREIVLSDQEFADYQTSGEKALERLARDICHFQSQYESRQVPDFHLNEEAKLAAKEWRAAHAQRP